MSDEREESHEQRLARWAQRGNTGSVPVAAATVIPLRDGPGGLEALMLRRNSKIAFGGMWVFPGGRVDPGDRDPARPDDEFAAARRAAVREAHEEAGLEISDATLLAYSHWTPPAMTPKRFLTWFFLTPAPDTDVVIDGGEIHEHAWLQPTEALRRQATAEIELAPPTWVTLHGLCRWSTVAECVEAMGSWEPEFFETRIAVESDGPTAIWHGDAGYADGDANASGPRHRLRMHRSGWSYQRSD